MNSPRRFLPFALWMLVAALVTQGFAKDSLEDKKEKTRAMRDSVLAELYKHKPELKNRIKKAEGYAVFSNVGVNLVLASFAGGHGVVVDSKGRETFMKMGSAGIGIGLGVKDFRGVFIFHDKAKLQAFIDKGWDFSGQADAAAKSEDKGGQLAMAGNVVDGVELYQLTKNGLALQATLQGTKYWKDRDLND
jgi:lipid-binding SYLF domain-containing protein